ncbi:ATP-binding protein [Variovorax paradoxus]|uniref:ATP-binding protein n=1 Tax=Variovorax paradoxus TaxID=34073 RepID=UPI003D658828
MYSTNLGLGIALAVGLGLAAVLAFIVSLFISNVKAGRLAREMAEEAKCEARQKMSQSSVQDLRPLIASLREPTADRPIRFDIRVPHEVVPVFGIEAELEELLSKVARYAANVMSPGATLQVSARVESGQAVVHWRDLDAADASPPLARFLEATQAAAHAASARVCERIAGRHGGRIYAAPHAGGALGLTLRLPLLGQTAASTR